MPVIAHISDLHFGTEERHVAEGLVLDLERAEPDLLVVSGDLTQRARTRQFLSAQRFLRRLPAPQLIVPGNHDVPLFDVFRRFFAPLRRYTRYISPELNPTFHGTGMTVLGLNTARSLTWKNGRISVAQMEKIRMTFSRVKAVCSRIIVTHHPFLPPPGEKQGSVQLVGRARESLKIVDACEIDLLLAGHLHHAYTGDVRTHYPGTRNAIIVAQAGTAISRRVREQPNAYNLITIDPGHIDISVRVWHESGFQQLLKADYRRSNGQWREVGKE